MAFTAMAKSYGRYNIQVRLLAGTTAAANIAVTGIATEDTIISALVFTTAAAIASVADLTSECSITSAGNIQFASTNTSSNQVLLIWMDASL